LGVIERIAFSPDGNSLAATRIWEDSALIWDLRDQTKPPINLPHPTSVRDISFSPDGRWIATTCEDGLTRLWDLRHTDWSTATLTLGDGAATTLAVAFSPDSRWVAAGGSDMSMHMWDLYADHPQDSVHSFDGEKSTVLAIAFSPDRRRVVVGSGDGWIRSWAVDAAPGTPPHRLYQHSGPVQSVTFDPAGDVLASSGDDTIIRLWDMTTQSIKAELRGHEASVADIAFSRDGQWLASAGSRDNTVKLWNLSIPNPQPITLRAHTSKVRGVAFSPTTDQVASGARDGTIRLWGLRRDIVRDVACTLVDRNLTEQEWTRVFTQNQYQKTCLIE
jgi:WD40 repeat protein